jgi:hypothetical protein
MSDSPNADEQTVREGGVSPGEQHARSDGSATDNREGGDVNIINTPPSANHRPGTEGQAVIPIAPSGRGVETPSVAAHHASTPSSVPLKEGQAISSFGFTNPFTGSAVTPVVLPMTASARELGSFGPPTSKHPVNGSPAKQFSTMTAQDVHSQLAVTIQALPSEAWISNDLSGSAILECVAPPLFNNFLHDTVGIHAVLIRERVVTAITKLIIQDESIQHKLREAWSQHLQDLTSSYTARASTVRNSQQQMVGGSVMGHSVLPAQHSSPTSTVVKSPSFMSEIPTRLNFNFNGPSQQVASDVTHPGIGNTATAVAGGGNVHVTFHTPSSQQSNFRILEELRDVTFYNWLKHNRKELLLADTANRRPFSALISQEVKEEIATDLIRSGTSVSSWSQVTDDMVLKVLFKMFGPRNSRDAKTRLSDKLLNFDDSTTYQDRWLPKLRLHFNLFKTTLSDFVFNFPSWPEGDDLNRERIVDALLASVPAPPEIMGPDGKTKVSQCANMIHVRDMIRENKRSPVEDIMNKIIQRFEVIDHSVKADPLVKYAVSPWKTSGRFDARKRKYNPITADQAGNNDAKKPNHGPSDKPRCNNCGSKGHACGERTCYLWGHPKAKGANGRWPVGTPSLRLEDSEWTEWKAERDPVFYAYPENVRKKQSPAKDGKNKSHRPNAKK